MGSHYSSDENFTFRTGSYIRTGSYLRTGSYQNGLSMESRVQTLHTKSAWKKNLDSINGTRKLMVIDFTASWCAPCKFIEPAFNALSAKFTDVIFVKIDVDQLMSVAQEYGVETMPTFLLIKNGKEVDKITGARKEELEKKIEKHMV
ncbi:Thioredoxin [Thalictrum thalictroides]|uniref:Thioredoxin n=1 Tax=Thalictrum thalictroides TaxID=46969 RepID=A0A7J6WXR7_THATH|nr:Thioredoxin [Thalictrum thalictroides]